MCFNLLIVGGRLVGAASNSFSAFAGIGFPFLSRLFSPLCIRYGYVV